MNLNPLKELLPQKASAFRAELALLYGMWQSTRHLIYSPHSCSMDRGVGIQSAMNPPSCRQEDVTG